MKRKELKKWVYHTIISRQGYYLINIVGYLEKVRDKIIFIRPRKINNRMVLQEIVIVMEEIFEIRKQNGLLFKEHLPKRNSPITWLRERTKLLMVY